MTDAPPPPPGGDGEEADRKFNGPSPRSQLSGIHTVPELCKHGPSFQTFSPPYTGTLTY